MTSATGTTREDKASRLPVGNALPTRQRRPGYVALAVILIVGLGTLGGWLYVSAGAKTAVVEVIRTVPAGQQIQRADLTTVEVSGAVTAIGGRNLGSAIGQTAAVTLLPNMLLQRSMITTTAGLHAGQAEVGVAVHSGQIPANGLDVGDTVDVLELPASDATSDAGTARRIVAAATVSAVRPDPAQGGGTLLTLLVPADTSLDVAAASGAGRVALVRVPASP